MRRTMTRSVPVLIAAVVFAGCTDSNDDDDDGTGPGAGGPPSGCIISEVCNGAAAGEVDGWVSGEVNEAVSGRADFLEESDGSWVIDMGLDEEGESGIGFTGNGGRPSTGVHAFDGSSPELGAFYLHGPSDDFYHAEAGELTVMKSTPTAVAGRFEFTATNEAGRVVTVEGTFDAAVKQGGVTIGDLLEAPTVDGL